MILSQIRKNYKSDKNSLFEISEILAEFGGVQHQQQWGYLAKCYLS